ncbi:hypothetical protein GGTG_04141 [Gaeumannomyces tritici R3-111a-1]|uniref:Uncharacterized protein n=1 Tax=Gaeumannomyces tritici (strain R3-111a-1) TaxID=644352 RepID=J3NS96_GAET3|nr:hypothetical protein GGTG_04141 [Gaeumannomyces tritici R3-111a-1]EJT79052.1 hypothetical protein GGTG_04141 [Gaeumannomyces tritici R3-111a-1]
MSLQYSPLSRTLIFQPGRMVLSDNALHALFTHWFEFLSTIISPSVVLRRDSPQNILRKCIQAATGLGYPPPHVVDQLVSGVDIFDLSGPSTTSQPVQAIGNGIRDLLQGSAHVLLEDGSIFRPLLPDMGVAITTLPNEGDLVCVLRGALDPSILRRIEGSSSPDDFRVVGGSYGRIFPDLLDIVEECFLGRLRGISIFGNCFGAFWGFFNLSVFCIHVYVADFCLRSGHWLAQGALELQDEET